MSRESERVRTSQRPTPAETSTPADETVLGTEVTEGDGIEGQTGSTSESDLDIGIGQDGTVRFSIDYKIEFQMDKFIGKIGGYLVVAGIFLVLISSLLFFIGLITFWQMLTIFAAPFAVGGGLMKLADSPEYFPFA